MIRSVVVLILVAAAAGAWWKREEVVHLAAERAPFLVPYLPVASTTAGPAPARPASSGIPVVAATVERRSLPVTLDAVGTVQSIASIAIKPRIDSQIASVEVREGARVKAGDLLLRLDDRAIRAQLAQAEALVEKDQAQVEQAKRDFARAEDLLGKRIGTEVQRDTASTNVKVLQAQLAADRASRDNLATSLSYTEIRSPIAGRIGSIALKIGTMVRSADLQAIATVNQIDPIYVSFSVPQSLFGDLRTALSAGQVGIQARVGKSTVPGIVAYVENTVDAASGTVLAKAEMANATELLWPGAFVAVQATLGVQGDAVAVPSAAVQIGQQGAFVFVIRADNRAVVTPVTVARTAGGFSIVSEGLSGGERVVVDGQLRLVDGAAVQVQTNRAREGVATGTDAAPAAQRRS